MRLPAKFVKVLVVLSASVAGVAAVNTPNLATASVTGVSCSVYVANTSGNSVSVIDAATNTVTATIPLGAGPGGVAVSRSGSVYVANWSGNSVWVIDAATNAVTATVPVGASPSGVAVSRSGSVYVANNGGNTVSVIDVATNSVTATIPVGGGPGDVAASAWGSVYVVNAITNDLSVIDSVTNSVSGTIEVVAGVGNVATSLSSIYVANNFAKVSVIDQALGMFTATIEVGSLPGGLAVSPSGSVYVADTGGDRVSVIDGSTNSVTATIGVGNSPKDVAVTPSGTVYVTNGASNTVSVIDGSTNSVTETIPVGASPSDAAVFCSTAAPGAVRMSPSKGTVSSTTFRPEPEGSGACPAGADARHTFLVDGSASLQTLQFGEAGPLVWDPRDVGKFAQPLFDQWGVQLDEYDGFADFPDGGLIGSFAWNGPIPDGTYQLGVACTKGPAGTGQVLSMWSTSVTISGSGAYWNVGTLADPRFTG